MKTTRNLWPTGIFVTFGLFFIGMASVVVIATTHRESLVSNNYYEQELKFQTVIDAAARANASGATIAFETASRRLTISMPAKQLEQKLSGKVQLYRPSASGLDREFPLAPQSDGTQTLNLAQFAPGLWVVRVAWNAAGADYRLEQKITI